MISKYYAIILDVSNQEQLTVILRFVECDTVSDSSGKGLFDTFLEQAKELKLNMFDCRGQSYDNGSNMKGKNSGVQSRILQTNTKALYVPCANHCLNLVVVDSVKSSTRALSFFGVLSRLYTIFSSSTQRWSILKEHVEIAVKNQSDTRWESRINFVMENEIRATEAFLEKYRENGFSSAETTAREIAEELNISRNFPSIRNNRKKKLFDYEGDDESAYKDNTLLLKCQNFHNKMSDIDPFEMEMELKRFIHLVLENDEKLKTAIHFLNYINSKCLQEVYPNVAIALRVLLTCPVTAATAERSFSKLKLIKNFHRSTRTQDRLSSLAMLSIESDCARKINCDHLIEVFADSKVRRKHLVEPH
nr:uncharacterized protein LOC124809423 [Hydra vulgaris]